MKITDFLTAETVVPALAAREKNAVLQEMASGLVARAAEHLRLILGELMVAEAKRAGMPLALACALVEKESSFSNVFGHDAVANPMP